MLPAVVLALVTIQRLGELWLSRRNADRLRARGGIEVGQGHYWPLILAHVAWLAGLWLLAPGRPVDPAWLGLYLALQLARAWVLASLGERWTTRIVVLPGAALVRRGPYRWVKHPNYLVLAAEVAVLPLVFGLWAFAGAFSILNAVLLAIRLRAETAALRRYAQPL